MRSSAALAGLGSRACSRTGHAGGRCRTCARRTGPCRGGLARAVWPSTLAAYRMPLTRHTSSRVAGGDGHLGDVDTGPDALDEDLRVEVEVVGVQGEGDPARARRFGTRGSRSGTRVSRVPSSRFWMRGQDSVADVLVPGIPPALAPPGVANLLPNAAPCRAPAGRADGSPPGVLPVAVQHDDNVETVVDGVSVSELLVAAISLVDRVGEQRPRIGQGGVPQRVRAAAARPSVDPSSISRTWTSNSSPRSRGIRFDHARMCRDAPYVRMNTSSLGRLAFMRPRRQLDWQATSSCLGRSGSSAPRNQGRHTAPMAIGSER